ncbi:MAG: glycosyl hydrolase-related protein [Armatimonadota bacterium]
MPQEQSLCEISSENVEISAMKQAEDGNGFIVRLFESSGKDTDFVFRFFNQQYNLSIKANELKTLRISNGKAVEVNLIEE